MSLQNGLDAAVASLRSIPPYGHREVGEPMKQTWCFQHSNEDMQGSLSALIPVYVHRKAGWFHWASPAFAGHQAATLA